MNDLPGHQNVRPDPQDEECYEHCQYHGDYEGMGKCPRCEYVNLKRRAAIQGLSAQIQRLTKHNAVDYQELIDDIKRGLNFIRDHSEKTKQ